MHLLTLHPRACLLVCLLLLFFHCLPDTYSPCLVIVIFLALNDLGLVYENWGKLVRAIEMFEKSLNLKKELNGSLSLDYTTSTVCSLSFMYNRISQSRVY